MDRYGYGLCSVVDLGQDGEPIATGVQNQDCNDTLALNPPSSSSMVTN